MHITTLRYRVKWLYKANYTLSMDTLENGVFTVYG